MNGADDPRGSTAEPATTREVEERLNTLLREAVPEESPQEIETVAHELAAAWPVAEVADDLVQRVRARLGERLDARLHARSRGATTVRVISRLRRPWTWVAVVGLAATVVAGILIVRTPSVSAEEVLSKAATGWVSRGIHSFELTAVSSMYKPDGAPAQQGSAEIWYLGPGRWRNNYTLSDPHGPRISMTYILTSQGQWVFNQTDEALDIYPPAKGGWVEAGPYLTSALHPAQLTSLLSHGGPCRAHAKLEPEAARVAGRPTYVVDIAHGHCPQQAVILRQQFGSEKYWIDRQTYQVLKWELFNPAGQLTSSTEVTSVRYNVPVDPALFHLTPPPGTTVHDFRPRPLPSPATVTSLLRQMAAEAPFPVFAPATPPSGMQAAMPLYNTSQGGCGPELPPTATFLPFDSCARPDLVLGYTPRPRDLLDNTWSHGVMIVERPAQAWMIKDMEQPWAAVGTSFFPGPTFQAAMVGPWPAWYHEGKRSTVGPLAGYPMESLTVEREGTLVTLTTYQISRNDLFALAERLVPIPGSHAPLSAPAAPGLAQIRAQAGFHILLPASVPAGLHEGAPILQRGYPAPPSGRPEYFVLVLYDAHDAPIAKLIESSFPPCSLPECRATTTVTLEPGATASYEHTQPNPRTSVPNLTGSKLWWRQDGTYIYLVSATLGENDLMGIARSMR